MDSIIIGKGCSLDTIFFKLLEAPGIEIHIKLYPKLAESLNTPKEQLQFLGNRQTHRELTYEQVIFQLIQEWTCRMDNGATLDAFLAALWSIEWNEIATFLSTELQKEVIQLDSSSSKVKWETCGSIKYDKSQILGKGSFGTIVYQGIWNDRPVAVKKLIFGITHEDMLSCEKNALLDYDGHENVIKYYCVEKVEGQQVPVTFIALELCDITLRNLVEDKTCISTPVEPMNILRQTTTGIEYLHTNGIIHRDIKPENILLVVLPGNEVRVKICDFGICRRMPDNATSVTLGTSSGTPGYMAPEILHLWDKQGDPMKSKMSRATDIFSLGCVYYYVLFDGAHPFGENQIKIMANVSDYKPQINSENFTARQAETLNLILNMISELPEDRPPAFAILKHHVFWPKKTILQFLIDVSNVVEEPVEGSVVADCRKIVQKHAKLRSYCTPARSTGWKRYLCPSVRSFANGNDRRANGYNGENITELIRVLRNMKLHYVSLPVDLQRAVGAPPEDFMDYWTDRFPLLVDTVWLVFEKLKRDETAGLEQYYCQFHDFNCDVDEVVLWRGNSGKQNFKKYLNIFLVLLAHVLILHFCN